MSKQQVNISLKDTTKIECEKCANDVFAPGLLLRSVSRFLTGTDKDALYPIEVFFCVKCQHVNERFYPKDLTEVQG